MKNLVLAGVHRICIIDDAKVHSPDLGQNFFLTSDDLGKARAICATIYLKVRSCVFCQNLLL